MACPVNFDTLRAKTEDLGPELYARAMGRSWWHSLIKRGTWPEGRGYVASVFEIARSAPGLQESQWQSIQSIANTADGGGACDLQYNQAFVGHLERQYKPEMLGIRGPVICQEDLTMYWNSREFWVRFFQRLEQIVSLEITNRHQTVYNSYVQKYGFVGGNMLSTIGAWTTQPASPNIDLSMYLPTGTIGLPDSELTYEQLEYLAESLITEGAHEKETGASRWITLGDDGPMFPLDIGMMQWRKLKTNNPEYRADINAAFQGWGEACPTLKRIGATGVMYNFRGVVNPFPARYIYVPWGTQVNFCTTGSQSTSGTLVSVFTNYSAAIGGYAPGTIQVAANYPGTTQGSQVPGAPRACGQAAYTGVDGNSYPASPYNAGQDIIIRLPAYCPSQDATDVTKGLAAVVNGCWRDANPGNPQSYSGYSGVVGNICKLESATVLNPYVMEEEPLIPVNAIAGMKWTPQNYYGLWRFVNGLAAFIGMDGCSSIAQPFEDKGRHFCQFRHAYKPIEPTYGAFLLYRQCPNSMSRVLCSTS